MSEGIVDFFVYGTLKRGECRQRCWPRRPTRVVAGVTRGQLFDLGDYPAMIEGSDWVAGEVWSFEPDDVAAVVAVLDEIEGFNRPGCRDLYRRVIVPWQSDRDALAAAGRAFTYRYVVQSNLETLQPIAASGGLVQWPAPA